MLDWQTIATVASAAVAVISAIIAITQTAAARRQVHYAKLSADAARIQATEASRQAELSEQSIHLAKLQLERSECEQESERKLTLRKLVAPFELSLFSVFADIENIQANLGNDGQAVKRRRDALSSLAGDFNLYASALNDMRPYKPALPFWEEIFDFGDLLVPYMEMIAENERKLTFKMRSSDPLPRRLFAEFAKIRPKYQLLHRDVRAFLDGLNS